MSQATITLLEKVIRHLKGILSAWEEWLEEQRKIAV